MHKRIFGILLLLISIGIRAQVTMTLQVAPEGIIQKPQLWNFAVTNTSNTATQVMITLTMNDAQTNDPVLTGSSGDVYVNNGVTPLLANNLAPIQYQYLSAKVTDTDPNGFLPVGQYQVCYKFYVFGHTGYEEVSEECINVFVEPINPPMLSLPYDGSDEEINMPQFSWLPPSPSIMFNTITYDFVLVEVTEGQTATEAIQQNMPVYAENNHSDIFLNYPSSSPALDTGKLYAWQIKAFNDNEYAAQSEVWTFKVKTDSSAVVYYNGNPYIKLQQKLNASASVCEGVLKFYYKNEAGDTAVTYEISSLDDDDLSSIIMTNSTSLHSGDNYIDIPLFGDTRLRNEKTYLLEVRNSRDERWAMKFTYRDLSLTR